MMRYGRRGASLSALLLLLVAGAMLGIGCGGDDDGDQAASGEGGQGAPAEGTEVRAVGNWFAQPELGGYFQAEAEGLGGEDGVRIDAVQGGPQIQTIPQTAAGEFDYGVAQADELLLAREEGVPIVMLFAPLDTNPQCMAWHPDSGIEGFEDFSGHPVAVAPSGGFWTWMKATFDYTDIKEINFTGSLAEFQRNEELVQQCFITDDPFVAEQEGIPMEAMLIADAGYNPYGNGLFTTEDKIESNPEEVAAVVAAFKEGWENYLEDPEPANELILEDNNELPEARLEFAHAELEDELVGETVGCMTEERWTTLADQLKEVEAIGSGFDVSEAWTNEYVPSC